MSAESKISDGFVFVWKIGNYSCCNHKKGEYIQSPVFTVESLGRSKWFLKLYPKGRGGCDKEYTACSLYRTEDDNGEDEIIINENVEIIRADGEILKSFTWENQAYEKNVGDTFYLMKIDDLAKKLEECKEDTLIIRYHIVGNKARKRPVTGCEAETKIGIDRYSFQWPVANFNSSDWVESKVLSFPMTSSIEITLTAPEDALLINIRKTDEKSAVSTFVTCRMSLLDVEGVEQHSKKDTHLFDIEDEISTWEFPSFVTKTQLNSKEHTFLKNGTFTIMCEFSVSSGMQFEKALDYKYDNSSAMDVFPQIDTFSSLKEDLRSMFISKKYPDVKLQIGDDIFPAHKSFLAARSPVFSAMFDQDMLESQTGVVNIPDMDAKTMSSFLSFVYTGTINKMDYEVTLKLFVAADKYQVESLKEKCASFLMSGLSDENVRDVLVVADMVSHKLLKEYAQDYIKARAGKILPSREWSQWIETNARLANEVLSKLSVDFGTSAEKGSAGKKE